MNPELEELKKSLKEAPQNAELLLQLGSYYLKSGYFKQAKEQYYLATLFNPHLQTPILLEHEKYIDTHPQKIQARLSLISFYLNCGDLDPAILELEELLEIDPKNVIAYNVLGRILIKQERFDEALALLEHALKLGIRDTQISEMLASLYLEKGRLAEAIQFYEELPHSIQNLRTLAELYTRIGKFNRAADKFREMYEQDREVLTEVIRKLEELLLKDETSVPVREILSEAYNKNLKPERAVSCLQQILKLDPQKIDKIINTLKQILKNYPGFPEANLALAEALTSKGLYSEAIEEYSRLVKHRPEYLKEALAGCQIILKKYPQQFLARQFMIDSYLAQNNYPEAFAEMKALLSFYKEGADWVIGKCREILKSEPKAREILGLAFLAKGDTSRAALEAETLLSSDRNSIPALLLLGETFLNQKLSRRAVETLNRALELDPYNIEIHKKYKEAREKELELELEGLKRRLAEDEWKVSLHLDLAKIYLSLNVREEALRELQSALRDQQRAPFVYYLMGNFHREEGRFDLAVSAFKKALEFSGLDLEMAKKFKFSLALAYEAQGLLKKSIKQFEEILQEDYDYPGLKEKIKFLKGSSLASVQNKMLVAVRQDISGKAITSFWGREARSSYKKPTLAVSFGQNYHLSGLEYFMKGMLPAAQEEFALSVQLDPNFLPGINNLGVVYLVSLKFEEALHKFREAFALEPASAIVSNNLGLTYNLMGNLAEAQKWLEKAAAVDKDLAAAQLNLADLYYSQNQAQKAIAIYLKIPATDVLGEAAQKRLLYKVP